MEKVLKIVEVSAQMPMSYKYARKRLRVVRCLPNQMGHRNEKDVEILYESYHYSAGSKGPKSDYAKYLAICNQVIAQNTNLKGA